MERRARESTLRSGAASPNCGPGTHRGSGVSQPTSRIGHNDVVTAGGGKRGGTRRGARPKQAIRPAAFVLALGVTCAVIAWGYLVYLAIMHGQAIRSGDGDAWLPAAASALGAVACLFVGFILVARLLGTLTNPSRSHSSSSPTGTGGGHRGGGHHHLDDKAAPETPSREEPSPQQPSADRPSAQ